MHALQWSADEWKIGMQMPLTPFNIGMQVHAKQQNRRGKRQEWNDKKEFRQEIGGKSMEMQGKA